MWLDYLNDPAGGRHLAAHGDPQPVTASSSPRARRRREGRGHAGGGAELALPGGRGWSQDLCGGRARAAWGPGLSKTRLASTLVAATYTMFMAGFVQLAKY